MSLATATASSAPSTADDRHHRPERLLGVEAHLRRDAGEHRRRDDVAVGLAARQHLGALVARVLDQLEHPLARGVVDQRADLVPGSRGSPHTSFAARSASLEPSVAGDGAVGDDPLGRHADLALVHERAEARRGGGRVEVGVGEHDLRRLAAELEQAALEVLGALDGDDPADPRGAREVHPPHRRVGDQRVDDLRRRPPRVGDEVDRARRKPGVVDARARRRRGCAGTSPSAFSTTVLP